MTAGAPTRTAAVSKRMRSESGSMNTYRTRLLSLCTIDLESRPLALPGEFGPQVMSGAEFSDVPDIECGGLYDDWDSLGIPLRHLRLLTLKTSGVRIVPHLIRAHGTRVLCVPVCVIRVILTREVPLVSVY